MNMPLFRHEAIEARRDRLAGTVIAATPPRANVYIGLLLGVIALIAALLVFGRYAARAEVKGVVAYDAGIARIVPNAPGEVRQVHVREGQSVQAGTPLVTLGLAQGQGGLTPQLSDLTNQDRALEQQQRLGESLALAEIGSLERQQSNLQAGIASLERQRGLADSQIRIAEADARRAAALAAEGAGTQRQVEEARATVLARRAELESLTERIITQRDALRAAGARIAERRIEAERSRFDVAGQRAALAEQRSGLSRQDSLVLAAPIAGLVEQVSAQPGQRASADGALATIVPQGSVKEIWLYAPSRAIGFVQPGQEVRLRFDAFPHQTYGAGRGTVTQVAAVPVDAATLDPALGVQEPVFRLRVRIDSLPGAAAGGARLRAGMTLSANLVLERRALWEILFNPFATAIGG